MQTQQQPPPSTPLIELHVGWIIPEKSQIRNFVKPEQTLHANDIEIQDIE